MILLLALIIGIVVGSIGAYEYVTKQYERIANEEIESVKETYSKSL